MRFASLNYLHLLWLFLSAIIFYIYSIKKQRKLLYKWAGKSLVGRLIQNVSFAGKNFKTFLILASIFFIITAFVQPQWGYHWQKLKRKGVDIIIALDTSKSMLADDVKPNRLDSAKRQIKDLLKVLTGDRVGLVTFAGTSFLQCPLTLDYGAFRMFLDFVDTNTMPQGGTDIGSAIREALNAFEKGSKKHRAVIIITDGEDNENRAEAAAKQAKLQGVPIYLVGIGSKEGSPIPIVDEKGSKVYLKDNNGNIVLSKLDNIVLGKIALITGGAYISGEGAGTALRKIYKERISKLKKKTLESKRKRIYENRYQWPLSIALILLLAEGLISEKKKNII